MDLNNLNFQHLRYFWTVAHADSLSAAAVKLHLTPQTVSMQIKDLEETLEEKLFQRTGRRLVLTEVGHVVLRYADEIFSLGKELTETLRGLPTGRPMRLSIGIADALPKIVAHHLIQPALELEDPVQIVCQEARPEQLLAELAVHNVDVVLLDTPIPRSLSIRAYNHLLGECGVEFMASPGLAEALRPDFPSSLDGAPFLLPTKDAVLRTAIDEWFEARSIRPVIVGEFDDTALAKVFGQAGTGVVVASSVVVDEVRRQYHVESLGEVEGVQEQY